MKTTTLTEKRFFQWHEDDISVTLRGMSGSYGGGFRSIGNSTRDILDAENRPVQGIGSGIGFKGKRLQGCNRLDYWGGDEMNEARVRRLTPLECERLQGFPDGWTDIGEWTDTNGKTKQTSDSARYKALGNSICTPFWFWLLRRISAQYERPATLGSLFDGIGGFPYCWERCNGKGTAIWASEIEEFPIAVTKKHFPERWINEVDEG